jgi:hypothetical protein
MHRIVASHLASFVEDHGLQSDVESERFEKFVNYAILSQKITSSFEIDQSDRQISWKTAMKSRKISSVV